MLFQHLTYFGKDAFLKNTSLLFSRKIEERVFLKPDTISLLKSPRPICVLCISPLLSFPFLYKQGLGKENGPTPAAEIFLLWLRSRPVFIGVSSPLAEGPQRQKKNPAHSTELLKAREEMLRTLSLLTGTC